jgi:copper chaperone CopZ
MKTIRFKTNIKCGGCIAKVTDNLNSATGNNRWQVDITNPDKILTVETEADANTIKEAVEKAGFKADVL